MKLSRIPAVLATLMLAAGGSGDTASYLVEGRSDQAFTLFRDKSYPGADWEVALVLTHLPDCQRKHRLKLAASGTPFKAQLTRIPEGDYVMRYGNAGYRMRLTTCAIQAIESDVPAGELVGSWEEHDGKLGFHSASKQ